MNQETVGSCSDLEPFALRVEGESMAPEFEDGCIIIIDPGYPPVSGAYLVIDYQGEYIFRQLILAEGKAYLNPVNPLFPPQELTDPYKVVGAVVQCNHGKRIVHYEYPEAGKILRREKFRGRKVASKQ